MKKRSLFANGLRSPWKWKSLTASERSDTTNLLGGTISTSFHSFRFQITFVFPLKEQCTVIPMAPLSSLTHIRAYLKMKNIPEFACLFLDSQAQAKMSVSKCILLYFLHCIALHCIVLLYQWTNLINFLHSCLFMFFSFVSQSYIMNFADILAKSSIHTVVLGTRGFETSAGVHLEETTEKEGRNTNTK